MPCGKTVATCLSSGKKRNALPRKLSSKLIWKTHRYRFAACRSGGFSVPKLLKITELSTSTKVSKKAINPPFLQTAVSGCFFIQFNFQLSIYYLSIYTLIFLLCLVNKNHHFHFYELNKYLRTHFLFLLNKYCSHIHFLAHL